MQTAEHFAKQVRQVVPGGDTRQVSLIQLLALRSDRTRAHCGRRTSRARFRHASRNICFHSARGSTRTSMPAVFRTPCDGGARRRCRRRRTIRHRTQGRNNPVFALAVERLFTARGHLEPDDAGERRVVLARFQVVAIDHQRGRGRRPVGSRALASCTGASASSVPGLPTCSSTYGRGGSGTARIRWSITVEVDLHVRRRFRFRALRGRRCLRSCHLERRASSAAFSSSLSGANGDGVVLSSTTR